MFWSKLEEEDSKAKHLKVAIIKSVVYICIYKSLEIDENIVYIGVDGM